MTYRIKQSGISMTNNRLLTSLKLGFQQMPSNSVSDVGLAGISSLAAERSLIGEISTRVMMKSAYQRQYSVDSCKMTKMGNSPNPLTNEILESMFPEKTIMQKSIPAVSPNAILSSGKIRALSRVSDISPTKIIPAHIVYLVAYGMDLAEIRKAIHRFPSLAYCSLDGKIKPFVEFLVDLGIQKQNILRILVREPSLCGMSLTENIIPTMAFLEELGIDKRQWAKVIHRCPNLLTFSREKLKTKVEFLCEMGLSHEKVGKVLTLFPNILAYSIEEKLRPTVEYFRSLDVDVGVLLNGAPMIFALNLDGNLKPKWQFFLTMGYAKSELLNNPGYFSYSLEKRIKPRYEIVRKSGVEMGLGTMLTISEHYFQELVKKKQMKKKLNV